MCCASSLRSCRLPAICLPHQDGKIPLSAFPNGTTSKLANLFPTLSFNAEQGSREVVNANFKVIGLTLLEIKPEFTAPEADALSTRPSELLILIPYIGFVYAEDSLMRI